MSTWHQDRNQSVFALMYSGEKDKAKVVSNRPGEMASVMAFSGVDCDEQAKKYYDCLIERGQKGLTLVLSLK